MAASRRFYLHHLSLWQQQGITLVSVGLDVALPLSLFGLTWVTWLSPPWVCLQLTQEQLLSLSIPIKYKKGIPFDKWKTQGSWVLDEPWLGHEARFPTCFTKDSCGKKNSENTGLLAGCQDCRLCTWSQGVSILRRGVMEEALCVWEESQRTLSFGQRVVGMELQALLGHVMSVFVRDGSLWLPWIPIPTPALPSGFSCMSFVASSLEFSTHSVIFFFLLRTSNSLRVSDRKKFASSSQKCGSDQQSLVFKQEQ